MRKLLLLGVASIALFAVSCQQKPAEQPVGEQKPTEQQQPVGEQQQQQPAGEQQQQSADEQQQPAGEQQQQQPAGEQQQQPAGEKK